MGNRPLIVIMVEKNGPNPNVARVIYNRHNNDCYLYLGLNDNKFAIAVYRNLKHKEYGLYAAACHDLLEADRDAFVYLNTK